jgi:hypothetical protein
MRKIITILSIAGYTAMLNAQAGNVGINTPTPTNTLTVNGNQSIGFRFQDAIAPSNGIIIEGNTGIGTPSPLSKLDVNGQTKIGDGTITPSAPFSGSILELNSESRGLRLPQVALTSTTQYFPMQGSGLDFLAKGMTVYNYNTSITTGSSSYPARGAGEYYWDGTGWVSKNSHGPQNSEFYFSVYRNTIQTIPHDVWTTINFTNKYFDKNNVMALPTNSFSIPSNAGGLYQINASYITESNNSAIQDGKIGVFVNDILVKSFAYGHAEPRLAIGTSASTSIYVQPGNVVTFKYFASSVVNQNITADIDFYQVSR